MTTCVNGGVYFDDDLFTTWQNFSSFNSTGDLQIYVCAYVAYTKFQVSISWMEGLVHCIFAILGIISSILTLITICKNKNFSSYTFYYFRLTAVLEIFLTMAIFQRGLTNLFDYSHSYTWVWLTYKIFIIESIFSSYVDILTIYLATERGIACLFPTKFHLINNRKTVYKVCIGVPIVLIFLYAPGFFAYQFIYVSDDQTYDPILSNDFYEIWERATEILVYFVAAGVIASSIIAVVGLRKATRLK